MASSYGEDASKNALREAYLQAESSLTPRRRARLDGELLRNFLAHPAYRKAGTLLAYLPFREEFDTRPLLARALRDGKRVALPRHVGGGESLEYVLIGSLDGAEAAVRRGDAQPLLASREELEKSICLVPGLVFDGSGHRVGYGAGYYDNFLASFPGKKVGLVRSMQISSNPLPTDEHDVAVDLLVSESCVWSCR